MSQTEDTFAVTANDLREGTVVYLDSQGKWTADLDQCRVLSADEVSEGLELGQQAEDRQEIVAAYEIAVTRDGDRVVPTRYREQIRAFGPSTHVDFARADVPEHLQHPDGVEPVRFTAS